MPARYTLYYAPGTAAMAVQAALEEAGAEYVLRRVDLSVPPERRGEWYLRLNPHGRVPTLAWENQVMFEAMAITLFIAETYPQAALAPPPGSASRARFLQWLTYMATTLQPAYALHYHPERITAEASHWPAVRATAARQLDRIWDVLEAAATPGPWLLGKRFGACDLYLQMLHAWHPERERLRRRCPRVAALVARVEARPAVRRMLRGHSG